MKVNPAIFKAYDIRGIYPPNSMKILPTPLAAPLPLSSTPRR
jgi:hypothetical protein